MVFQLRTKLYACNVLLVLFLSGCSSLPPALMPMPNIYTHRQYSEDKIAISLRKTDMDLIYVTDRDLEQNNKYGSMRSASMAYGIAKVGFQDKSLSWNELLAQSSQKERTVKLTYLMQQVNELGRFPATPYTFKPTANGMQIDASVLKQKNFHQKALSNIIRARLSESKTKDVVLFVHGFNNTFNDAAYTLAGIWHFMERQGVPLLYSWPAAKGGLTGYFTDRESGEYTIYHLKETLRLLFDLPEIENIHVIAHSRGTDVVTSALRELIIENRAKGGEPRKDLRIANLILAAPDLDFGIIKQRIMAEQLGPAFGQITIYTSQADGALQASQWLMHGLRFGRLRSNEVGENERNIFNAVGNVSLIRAPKKSSLIGHDYFHRNPAVSSDLINAILYKAAPGSKERPLTKIENNFWSVPSDYLSTD